MDNDFGRGRRHWAMLRISHNNPPNDQLDSGSVDCFDLDIKTFIAFSMTSIKFPILREAGWRQSSGRATRNPPHGQIILGPGAAGFSAHRPAQTILIIEHGRVR